MLRLLMVLTLLTISALLTPATVSAQFPTPGVAGGLTALARTDRSTWPNSIVNGGFEITPALASQGGAWTAAKGSESAWRVDKTVAHSGGTSLKMSGVAGAQAYEVFHLVPGYYTFTAFIRTGAGGSGRARLMLDLRTGRYESVGAACASDCGINVWHTSQEIESGADWTQVSVSFVISETEIAAAKPDPARPGTIKAFAVLDGFWASGQLTAWYDDVELLHQPPFPLDVFMRYPNYRGMLFSDQDQALRFHVTPLAPYVDTGHTLKATLIDEASGAVLETADIALSGLTAESETEKPGITVTLNSGGAALGGVARLQPVLARFQLIDGSGREVTPGYPAYRVYKVDAAVKPTMNVSFDADNHVVLGVPRFVLGVYDSSPDSTIEWERSLFDPAGARRMSGLPINLYLNYHLGDSSAEVINNLMTVLSAHKVAYLQTGNCFSSFPASEHNAPDGFKIDQAGDGSYPYVSQGAPTGIGQMVAGYYTADECTPDMIEGVFAQYRRLIERDPDSMTFAALFGANDLPLWRDAVDVLSTDPYPLFGAEPVGGYNHGQVAAWTRLSVQAVQRSRPVMTVLQFFKFDGSSKNQGRWPTQREMRNHAYMAIIEGANGLLWWSLGQNGLLAACGQGHAWCAERTQRMNDLKAVVSDLAALEPVLLKPSVTTWAGSVASVTLNGSGASSPPPASIKTLVKRDEVAGIDYVFAYNTTPYYDAAVASPSVTVHFQLPAAPQSIRVYGEGRSLGASATLSDTFGPFEAHVYVVKY